MNADRSAGAWSPVSSTRAFDLADSTTSNALAIWQMPDGYRPDELGRKAQYTINQTPPGWT